MFGHYYPRTIYGLIAGFIDMFNNIKVRRYDDTFRPVKQIDVPITFGPMSKYYMFEKESESGVRYYQQLPAMAVILSSTNYSPQRSVGNYEQRTYKTEDSKYLSDYVPTPVDIGFQLTIRTESMEDWCQIIEQILPYFNPELHLSMKEFPMVNVDENNQDSSLLGIERNIPIKLISVSGPEMLEEQDGESRPRYVNSTIDFLAEAVMYKKLNGVTPKRIQNIRSYVFTPIDKLKGAQPNYEEITIKLDT